MNAKHMKQLKLQSKGNTNWSRVKSLTEKEIIKAAEDDFEAKPLTQAELKKFKKVIPPKTVNIKAIRHNLNLSQEEFARYFGVNKRTIQEWEQGRRSPTTTARNFLKVIEREPKAVQRALTER